MTNWTWTGVDANQFAAYNTSWFDAGNWANNVVPTIASGDTVTLVPLIFGGNGGGWNISFYATLFGTLANSGTIDLEATDFTDTHNGADGPSSFDLLLGGNTTLTGGGTIVMNADGYCTISGPYTLINVDNTIEGSGYLGGEQGGNLTTAPSNAPINLVNAAAGTIEQTGSGGAAALTIDGTVTNSGLIEATGSGGLLLNSDGTSGIIDQTGGGTLFANGGNITFTNADIEGGTLEGANGGQLLGNISLDGTSDPVTIDAGTTVSAGSGDITLLAGAGQTSVINNEGTILLATTATNSPPSLRVGTYGASGGLVKLTGGGVVSFTYTGDPGHSYSAFIPTGTLENVNNTIEGMVESVALTLINDAGGTIDFSNANYQPYVASTLTNSGLIEATGAAGVSLSGSTINQSGGGTLLADGGDIYTGELDVIGGTLATKDGSSILVQGPNEDTLTLDGTASAVTIAAGAQVEISATAVGQSIDLAATSGQTSSIVNKGEIVVYGSSNQTFAGNTLYIGSGNAGGTATVKLSGGGVVDLVGGAIGDGLINGEATLENVDNTLEGSGLFGLRFALVNDAGGTIDANTITIGATLAIGTGYATVNNGVLEANGGTLLIDDSVTGTGTGLIEGGGTLEMDENFDQSQNPIPGPPAFNQNVTFDGAGELILRNTYSGVLSGVARGDKIDLANIAYATGEQLVLQSTSGGVQTFALETASDVVLETLQLAGVYAASDFTVTADSNNDALISFSIPVEVPNDFTGDGRSDIVFEGEYTPSPSFHGLMTWQVNGLAVTGGGSLGTPGVGYTYEGSGNFYGPGDSDVLWRNQNGDLDIWEMSGTSVIGGGDIGNPGAGWSVAGVADVYGVGYSDILLQDASGDLVEWEMSGTTVVASHTIGNPGAAWTLLGTGDFNGDGKSDLLFEDAATGQYAVWNLSGASVIGSAVLGTLGGAWVYKGVGNFNGAGDSDILFENVVTGQYATWDVADDKIGGGGVIGAPSLDWRLADIGNFTTNGHGDLLFQNVLTGQYATWDIDDTTISAAAVFGSPGEEYAIASGLPAASEPAATLVFDKAGDIATWTISDGAITGGSDFGNPGSNWTELAVGDFYGDGQTDILWQEAGGDLAIWRTNGASIVSSGMVGAPYGWTVEGLGDFDGDGTSDILLKNNLSGDYATWLMNGTSILGWGDWGTASGLNYVATGDFTGDGTSDVLFTDSSGNYYVGLVANDTLATPVEIGAAAGWAVVGVGDLNGDGKTDILFKNSATGVYASWDMNGTSIVGGGAIGNPGSAWTFEGIAALNPGDHASIVFENLATGQVATWEMNDTAIAGGVSIGYAAGFGLIGVR